MLVCAREHRLFRARAKAIGLRFRAQTLQSKRRVKYLRRVKAERLQTLGCTLQRPSRRSVTLVGASRRLRRGLLARPTAAAGMPPAHFLSLPSLAD